MTTEIANKPVEGISFETTRTKYGATDAQIALHKKMNEYVKRKEILPLEEVRKIYIFHVLCGGSKKFNGNVYDSYDCDTGKEHWININLWDYYNDEKYRFSRVGDYQVKQWLRCNIGSMVLNNMLVAVPVFEIQEDANKD